MADINLKGGKVKSNKQENSGVKTVMFLLILCEDGQLSLQKKVTMPGTPVVGMTVQLCVESHPRFVFMEPEVTKVSWIPGEDFMRIGFEPIQLHSKVADKEERRHWEAKGWTVNRL